MDTSEGILSKERSLMEEEESDLCPEEDMEVVTDQDMIVPLFVILPLFGDLTPEADQSLEEETDFVGIDRGHQTGLQISRNVLDISVKLAKR